MAGPIIAAAGVEAAKHLSGRRQRKLLQQEAASRAANSHQTARAALIGMMGQPMSQGQFEGLQTELRALDANETERVRLQQRGLNRRRGIAAAALLGVFGAAIGGGLIAMKEIKDWFRIPVSVSVTEEYGSALEKVQKLTDQRLVRGSGVGVADMSLRVKVGPLTIPGAIAGEDAKIALPRNEEISLRSGGEQLMRTVINGQERVVVLVDPRQVDAEITGAQDPLPGSGASVGTINSLFQAVGFDRGEQSTAYQTVTDIAAQSFAANASRDMTTPQVLAALAADDTRTEMRYVAGGVDKTTRSMLLQAAAGTIYVEFADLSGGHGHGPTFIPPAREQSFIHLPEVPQATSATIGHVVLSSGPENPSLGSVNSAFSNLESSSAAQTLAGIVAEPGYELLSQPVGIPG